MTLAALFASSAKHTMDHAIHYQRMSVRADDYWHRVFWDQQANKLRLAAWDHLAAARKEKRRAAA